MKRATLLAALLVLPTLAHAEVDVVNIPKGAGGVGFLPLVVMEELKLVEQEAQKMGIRLGAEYIKFGGPSVVNDMLLSGNAHYAAAGPPAFITLWDKTTSNMKVKGVAAMTSIPMYLNTNAAHLKSLKDLTPSDKIAVTAVKVSIPAIIMQMAAIKEYGKYTGVRSTCVFGGVDIKQQLAIVRAGVEILVATPGRLLDHVEQKSVSLGQVEIFVLDEADRMLDMGFIPDIKRIMKLLPATAKRQNLLWSATFSNEIKKLADELLNQPQLIEVARRNTAAETVTQTAYKVPADAKRALLTHVVRSRNVWQVLCFVRTKHGASRLARQLEKDGLATSAIHGDKTQIARLEALSAFKEGKLQVLVATDVAARGLDIDDLPLVVNYELPHVPEDYIHRIGRTGRAGATGEAMSLDLLRRTFLTPPSPLVSESRISVDALPVSRRRDDAKVSLALILPSAPVMRAESRIERAVSEASRRRASIANAWRKRNSHSSSGLTDRQELDCAS